MDDLNWCAVAAEGLIAGLVVALGVALTAIVAGVQRRRQAVEEGFHQVAKGFGRVTEGLIAQIPVVQADEQFRLMYDEVWVALGVVQAKARWIRRGRKIRAAADECSASLSALVLMALQFREVPDGERTASLANAQFRALQIAVAGKAVVVSTPEDLARRRREFQGLDEPEVDADVEGGQS